MMPSRDKCRTLREEIVGDDDLLSESLYNVLATFARVTADPTAVDPRTPSARDRQNRDIDRLLSGIKAAGDRELYPEQTLFACALARLIAAVSPNDWRTAIGFNSKRDRYGEVKEHVEIAMAFGRTFEDAVRECEEIDLLAERVTDGKYDDQADTVRRSLARLNARDKQK